MVRNWEKAERLKKLPLYLFVEIDRLKKKLISQEKDIIDLGIGDPDLATPQEIIEELYTAVQDPTNHRYPLDLGLNEFRYAVGEWFQKRFGVELDPDKEILPLIGSKEGIAHFPLAVVNPGDLVLIPEPLYPPYRSGAIFAGAEVYYLPLKEENGFLPNLSEVPSNILSRTKILYLNYPNNPTAAVVNKGYLKSIVEMAYKYGFCILYDNAYSEICFDNYRAPSILEVEGGKDVAIEFHSFSKTFNMTGWRVGWACGNRELIDVLRQVKSNIDSGIFNPIQYAGIKALEIYDNHLPRLLGIYTQRRDLFVTGLRKIGWMVPFPKATFYVWAKIPTGTSSTEFCKLLLEECYIVATPGVGFGPSGEGYVRFALTTREECLQEAVDRIKKIL
jgi:LL-diaminopimelate aminotransferase